MRHARTVPLERIAGAIEEVWSLSLLPATYARNAARIGELESELADSKIADRARGMLASGTPPATPSTPSSVTWRACFVPANWEPCSGN